MSCTSGWNAEILRQKGGIKGPTRVWSVSLDRDDAIWFDAPGGTIVTEPSDVVLEILCPRSVYQTLRAQGKDKQTLGREARESLALRLYGEHRLSLGKAAELAALPIVKFMDLLQALQMPVVEYGEDEYAQDIRTIADLTGPSEETR